MKQFISIICLFFVVNVLGFGQPLESEIKKIIANIDTNGIEGFIKDLSGEKEVLLEGQNYRINNRSNNSPLNSVAAKYVYYKFKEYGYEPHFSVITKYNTDLETVYAVKIGKTLPEDVVVFAASHDSYPVKNANGGDTISPGANGNAAGLSVVLEAARIFSNIETERTIIFVSFDDWALSGAGTYYFLDSLKKSIVGEIFCIGLDLIGYYNGEAMSLWVTDTNVSKLVIEAFNSNLSVCNYQFPFRPIKRATPFFSLSNSGSQEGYFCVFPPNIPFIKTPEDTYSNLNLEFLHSNARLAIAALAYIAGLLEEGLPVEEEKTKNFFEHNGFLYCNEYLGYEYYLFNTLGILVKEGIINSSIIECKYLPKGLYMLIFTNGQTKSISKFIIF